MIGKGLVGATVVAAAIGWMVLAPIAAGAAESAATVARPAVVPVSVRDGQGTALGARPTVMVRVGRSKPVPVLLDTGSSGLRIFDSAVATGPGSGVKLTTRRSAITYAGGHRFTGVVATAVVTIGSSATSAPVSFADVQRAYCTPQKPTCPAAGGMAGFERTGGYGILGIGTQPGGGGLLSPILGMPAPRRSRWSLHLEGGSGSLVLGARLPAAKSATAIPMVPIPSAPGAHLWADSRLPLCVGVGADHQCGRGLFDSGTYTMQVSGPAVDSVPTVAGTDHVSGGLPVTLSLPGARAPFWSFSTGTTKSKNLVTITARRGSFVNSGVQAFYAFTVTYDDVAGRIWLSP
jgi:Protein of unknown function (DUF3443)